MTTTELPADGSWLQLTTGAAFAAAYAKGQVEVGYTGTGPGFPLPQGYPVSVPNVGDLGGAVWARSLNGGFITWVAG